MAHPIRLQLSRRKGLDLQALSRGINGLPAASVVRPSRWGNPYKVGDPGLHGGMDAAEAVARYRLHVLLIMTRDPDYLEPLRKKNLACWCAADEHCHADVLLDLANR